MKFNWERKDNFNDIIELVRYTLEEFIQTVN